MERRVSRRAFLGTTAVASAFQACRPCRVVLEPPIPTCRGEYRFQNWAETISCRPSSYCQPSTLSQTVDLVKSAIASGQNVRTVGAGHSWAPLVLTNDVLVNLDRMQKVRVNKQEGTATMEAGIRLKNLIPELRRHGLGMRNLGSITQQSIAGAVATGTHGTGLRIGNLSTQVVGMKIVNGTGDVVDVRDGDYLRAARVSLGALGIVTEVTLSCVPDYDLEYSAYWCQFSDIVDHLDTLSKENERVRLWWLVWTLGCREHVIVTTMNPPGTPPGLLGKFERITGTNGGATDLPMDTEKLLKERSSKAGNGCFEFAHRKVDYDKALNVPLLPVLHRECEYAIRVDRSTEALRGCKKFFDDGDVSLKLPVEVRFAAQDDSLLSPSRGQDVCYIGISTQKNATEVFARFEPFMKELGGRPHWGKFFSLTSAEARAMYPDSYDRFREIRKEFDPNGVFENDVIRQLFV